MTHQSDLERAREIFRKCISLMHPNLPGELVMEDKVVQPIVDALSSLTPKPDGSNPYAGNPMEWFCDKCRPIAQEHLKQQRERLTPKPTKEDEEVTSGVLRMENKKLGGTLSAICKLLKDSKASEKYFDQADLASTRKDALEEAAKVAENDNYQCYLAGPRGNAEGTAKFIAQAIRSLIEREGRKCR